MPASDRGGLSTPEPPLENIVLIITSLDSQYSRLWKHCPRGYIASPLPEATFLFLLCSPVSSRRLRRSAGVSVECLSANA